MLATGVDTAFQVTLRAPVPLDTELDRRIEGDMVLLLHDGRLLAEAMASDLDLEVPDPPDFDTAVDASTRYIAFQYHPFPGCFVCGTARDGGDGLRIFAGPVESRRIVASPWVPDSGLADESGVVDTRVAWAALDCPGAYADMLGRDPVPQVLGRISGRIDRPVAAGDRCVVIGWPIGAEGRKRHVGTAIFDSVGRLCASARATWFDVEQTGSESFRVA
jgi:hypothetical protein